MTCSRFSYYCDLHNIKYIQIPLSHIYGYHLLITSSPHRALSCYSTAGLYELRGAAPVTASAPTDIPRILRVNEEIKQKRSYRMPVHTKIPCLTLN